MRITIWGCRGSLATPGPGTLKFGGNTSCVTAELSDGTLIVFDAGTDHEGFSAGAGQFDSDITVGRYPALRARRRRR